MFTESKDQQEGGVAGGSGVRIAGHPGSTGHRAGVGSVCHKSLEGWNDLVRSPSQTLLSVGLRGWEIKSI